jgi:uncharacterized repeat protein (TIGR01451 family)
VTGTPPSGPNVTDDGSATVDLPQNPAIEIVKSLASFDDNDTSTTITLGDDLWFEFFVTNTGNVTLNNIDVADDTFSIAVTCPVTTLAPGASTTCDAVEAHRVTLPEANDGNVQNTATATGDCPDDSENCAEDDDTLDTPVEQNPAIEIVKSLDSYDDNNGSGSITVGDGLWYSFEVTNIGDVTLSNIDVTDDTFLIPVTCPATPLAPAESMTCKADEAHEVTEAEADAETVQNTATTTGDCPDGTVDCAEDSDTLLTAVEKRLVGPCIDDYIYAVYDESGRNSQFFLADPSIGFVEACLSVYDYSDFEGLESQGGYIYAISAQGSGDFEAGGLYILVDEYCATELLFNTGYEDIEGLALNPRTGVLWGVAGGSSNLSEGTLITIDIENELAEVASVPLSDEKIEGITWSLDEEILYGAGDGDMFIYDFDNFAWQWIASLAGFDEIEGLETDVIRSLAEEVDVLIFGEHGDSNIYFWNSSSMAIENFDTILYDDTEGIVVCKEEVFPRAELGLNKELYEHFDTDGLGYVNADDQLTYTIEASNTGALPLTGVTVSDPMLNGTLNCTWPDTEGNLEVGESVTCTGTYTVTSGDETSGSITNTATADSNETGPITDSVTLPVGAPPENPCVDRTIYAVFDEGGRDSQFFTVNSGVNACGGLFDTSDFEGLESWEGDLYAISAKGEGDFTAGDLYKLDGDCNVTAVVHTHYTNIEGLALGPSGYLWGVAGNDSELREGSLIVIDMGIGSVVDFFEVPEVQKIEGIAWSTDGNTLYGAGDNDIFVFDSINSEWDQIATSVISGEIEGLEIDALWSGEDEGDVFILGVHGEAMLYYWSTVNGIIGSRGTGTYDDTEGIVLCK